MTPTSCAVQAGRTYKMLTGSLVRNLLIVSVWLMACLAAPVMAQPVKGSTYKDFLPLGSGSSVALPEGTWEATQISAITNPGSVWEIYTLKNQEPDAKVPFLVVRQTTTSGRWGNTGCLSNNIYQFMVNEHGTRISEILNKCSRVFAIGNFDSWKTLAWANPADKQWWSDAAQGMVDTDGVKRGSIFQVEFTVQQFNGKRIRLDAFVLPPKGMTAAKFRDDFRAGQVLPEHQILSGWASIYIESMQQSFFNKKPQPIMALAYPISTVAEAAGPARPVATAPASASTAPVVAAAVPKVEPGSVKPTQASQAPNAASSPAPLVAAARVEPAAVKPAPVVVADNSAQLKMEQERRAMDEEKRKMAQQLEVMTQMLAKLQQENALATAAAKAKEAAAAAPEPVQPKEPVTYANRKALVIGNDLYTHVPKLNNAGADADAMAKSLEAVGYKVFKHLNLNEKKFKQAVRDFRQNLTGGDEVLFFYAGHGVQLGNANYLLPIDVQGDQEEQVRDDAILLQKVLDDLEEKKTKFALAVIDACRDNPFKSKGRAIGGRGLAPTSAATGQMIMFSAGSGQQALDRLGDNDKDKNGLFTRIFVKEMTKPGLSVDRVLRNVRNEVVRLARSVGHEQTPALYDQAIGEFYFKQ